MKTCLKTVLGAVALAAVSTALCPFSAWARGGDRRGEPTSELSWGQTDPAPEQTVLRDSEEQPVGAMDDRNYETSESSARPRLMEEVYETGRQTGLDQGGKQGDALADVKNSAGKGEVQGVFVPIVRTLEVKADTNGNYLFRGKVLADGGASLSAVGFLFSTSLRFQNPRRVRGVHEPGSANFRVETDNLLPGKTIYYRAYARNSVGENRGSPGKFIVPEATGKGTWWSQAESLSADWRRSNWFGTYRKVPGMDWVYHQKLGWTYVAGDQREGLWLWQKENGWTWTQPGVWPFLWRNDSGSWLRHVATLGGKPIFYDYRTGKFRNLPKKQAEAEKETTGNRNEKTESTATDPSKDPTKEGKRNDSIATDPARGSTLEGKRTESPATDPGKTTGRKKDESPATDPGKATEEQPKTGGGFTVTDPADATGEQPKTGTTGPHTHPGNTTGEQPKTGGGFPVTDPADAKGEQPKTGGTDPQPGNTTNDQPKTGGTEPHPGTHPADTSGDQPKTGETEPPPATGQGNPPLGGK
tara:strand:- start:2673 stop:4256 length:1584 start_codon:yes stop_codon:yes gene_type:complete